MTIARVFRTENNRKPGLLPGLVETAAR